MEEKEQIGSNLISKDKVYHKEPLSHEKKIDYLQLAAGICGFGIQEQHLDLLITIYEKVLIRKGEYSLDEMTHDKLEVDRRWEEKLKTKKDEQQ